MIFGISQEKLGITFRMTSGPLALLLHNQFEDVVDKVTRNYENETIPKVLLNKTWG